MLLEYVQESLGLTFDSMVSACILRSIHDQRFSDTKCRAQGGNKALLITCEAVSGRLASRAAALMAIGAGLRLGRRNTPLSVAARKDHPVISSISVLGGRQTIEADHYAAGIRTALCRNVPLPPPRSMTRCQLPSYGTVKRIGVRLAWPPQ